MEMNLTLEDEASIFALGQKIARKYGVNSISELLDKLNISSSSESRNRFSLVEAIEARHTKKEETVQPKQDTAELDAAKELIQLLQMKSGAINKNSSRRSYAAWYKDALIETQKAYKLTWKALQRITGIHFGTLHNFEPVKPLVKESELSSLHISIRDAWQGAPAKRKKTLLEFWNYLGINHTSLEISQERMRQVLVDLGLYSPRGMRPKNEGAVSNKKLPVHSLWGGDGKQMNIFINGVSHKFVWYALTDQTSTLITGFSLTDNECAKSITDALEHGKSKTDVAPIGLLIDNRIDSESEVSQFHKYCDENGIILVRTFPGNSKSNIAENTFSQFEKDVGDIHVSGASDREIARSIALAIADIYTKKKNRRKSSRKGGVSPLDIADGKDRPVGVKPFIEALSERLNKVEVDLNVKWAVIQDARKYFIGEEEQLSSLKYKLKKYTCEELLCAQSAYIAQIRAHPDKIYSEGYFMAILRHKREEKYKQAYNEQFRAGLDLFYQLTGTLEYSENLTGDILAIIENSFQQNCPTEKMLCLDSIAMWLANNSVKIEVSEVWNKVAKAAESTRTITANMWQVTSEFLHSRIGNLLHPNSNVTPREKACAILANHASCWLPDNNLQTTPC